MLFWAPKSRFHYQWIVDQLLDFNQLLIVDFQSLKQFFTHFLIFCLKRIVVLKRYGVRQHWKAGGNTQHPKDAKTLFRPFCVQTFFGSLMKLETILSSLYVVSLERSLAQIDKLALAGTPPSLANLTLGFIGILHELAEVYGHPLFSVSTLSLRRN